ncbi:hypothetical protein KC19_3G098000 [Ceratodon purpureus]|uniref:Uncharacterized protein n=1 Tax=Ceratodon purpureus TaxID=3225 RepID=A0A8T0IJH9_CERPU|nr:hypothetical protein KC19_3G098000 [Ceratodon purpureus]
MIPLGFFSFPSLDFLSLPLPSPPFSSPPHPTPREPILLKHSPTLSHSTHTTLLSPSLSLVLFPSSSSLLRGFLSSSVGAGARHLAPNLGLAAVNRQDLNWVGVCFRKGLLLGRLGEGDSGGLPRKGGLLSLLLFLVSWLCFFFFFFLGSLGCVMSGGGILARGGERGGEEEEEVVGGICGGGRR